MKVVKVVESTRIEANQVYVIPPGRALSSEDGSLAVTELTSDRARRSTIDYFFRTLADTHGPNAMAVVFSGIDGDGAVGIKRVKERGGLTIAQEPEEAEHGGMPRAAIATGMVDWVLRVAEMPQRLMEYMHLKPQMQIPSEVGPPLVAAAEKEPDGEAALREVLAYLRTRTGRDFTYYKRATIVRRVARRMQVNGVVDLPSYLTFLRAHPGEAGALLKDLLISVTNFFRDPEAFQALEQAVPMLFRDKGPNDAVRVWVPGCATGEEAYSIAILLSEHARTLDAPPAIQIFATDLDEEAIHIARAGAYPEAIAADVSEERLRRFFLKDHRGYRVRREIRERILFSVHDLLKDPPFSHLQLVSCRNLLIYLNRDAQQRAFELFDFALCSTGLLFLGMSEIVDVANQAFSVRDKKHRLYVHRPRPGSIADLQERLPKQSTGLQPGPTPRPVITRAALEKTPVFASADDTPPGQMEWSDVRSRVAERLAPPFVIVDGDQRVVHVSPNATQFLRWSAGELSFNLFKLVHPMLSLELRAAMYRAVRSGAPEIVPNVPVSLNGDEHLVTMRVERIEELDSESFVVVFDAQPPKPANGILPSIVRVEPSRQLEQELDQMKSRLRDTVEQYEASTEELKSGNEELQALNEELRSATEELEASREELQSNNEELRTVNQELSSRLDELAHANSDLNNLMASTSIATVFLDRDFCITRYTPRAVELFNLIPTDVGRPLSDLTHRMNYAELPADARSVLEHLTPVEREVRGAADRWFLARLFPYRTVDDRIAGVVLTFIDISEQKQAAQAARENEAAFQAVFELSCLGMAQAEPMTSRLMCVNRRLADMLGFATDEILTRTFLELTDADDRSKTRQEFEQLLKGTTREGSWEAKLLRKDGRLLPTHINATLLRDADGKPFRTVAVILDITPRG
jgi:two-component system CheB/CheR fusion protein